MSDRAENQETLYQANELAGVLIGECICDLSERRSDDPSLYPHLAECCFQAGDVRRARQTLQVLAPLSFSLRLGEWGGALAAEGAAGQRLAKRTRRPGGAQ